MAQGKSGRVVLEIDPGLKRRLHAELSFAGVSMKEWFIQQANQFLSAPEQECVNENSVRYVTKSRQSQQKEGKIMSNSSVISMFSGCGGMDLGFRGGFDFLGRTYGVHPFDIVWANDLNKAACRTYRQNLDDVILEGDIWGHLDSMPESADIVIGGFPCQDISVNGKRAGVAGERSGLYRAMVEAVRKTRPKVFVAENVKGLLMDYNRESLDAVFNDFSSLGYNVTYQLYRAADYGVPQMRERVFIVGTRPDVSRFKAPASTHSKLDWISCEQALHDLEWKEEDPKFNHIWSRAKKSPEQGNRRLKADRPGHTIRAECHGNIQFHYKLPRRISMREAARIQSFPDTFIFSSGLREIERQVGNAVPPVLAWHIAGAVAECLEGDVLKGGLSLETNDQKASSLLQAHQLA